MKKRPPVTEKICGKCGQPFWCGAIGEGDKCWCESVSCLPQPLEGDCYCPKCLEEEIKKRRRNGKRK